MRKMILGAAIAAASLLAASSAFAEPHLHTFADKSGAVPARYLDDNFRTLERLIEQRTAAPKVHHYRRHVRAHA